MGNEELKLMICELLDEDPLFEVIKDTPLEDELYSDDYLAGIVEKKYYSTPEVAEWFGINDGQLRYYIKPFSEYLFKDDDEAPSSSTAFRLSFSTILKLRMIILLKDEYRVKGLQRLLGLDGHGFIEKKPVAAKQTGLVSYDDLEKKVEGLSSLLQQILSTGLFEVEQHDDGPKLTLRRDAENQSLKTQMIELKEKQDNRVQEEAQRISTLRRRFLESSELRSEAVEEWLKTSKPTMMQRIFKAEQLEIEKEKYIQDYVKRNINERLGNEKESPETADSNEF